MTGRLKLLLPLICLLQFFAGCVKAPAGAMPAENVVPDLRAPSSTRVLGQATLYISTTGEKLEVVHDAATDVAIIKLPDGEAVLLPAEIAGSGERFRDKHMTLWEHDGAVLLWVDGKLEFSGRVVN